MAEMLSTAVSRSAPLDSSILSKPAATATTADAHHHHHLRLPVPVRTFDLVYVFSCLFPLRLFAPFVEPRRKPAHFPDYRLYYAAGRPKQHRKLPACL